MGDIDVYMGGMIWAGEYLAPLPDAREEAAEEKSSTAQYRDNDGWFEIHDGIVVCISDVCYCAGQLVPMRRLAGNRRHLKESRANGPAILNHAQRPLDCSAFPPSYFA